MAVAIGFTAVFGLVVVPPLIQNPDIVGAFAAGFANPYAFGYSTDVLFCWAALAVWIVYEATSYNVRHGWLCLVLGMVLGVAVGFAGYLILRSYQLKQVKLDSWGGVLSLEASSLALTTVPSCRQRKYTQVLKLPDNRIQGFFGIAKNHAGVVFKEQWIINSGKT